MKNKEKDDNQKFNAFIKLCLWGIFIVFVVLISNFGSKKVSVDNNKETEEVKTITYEEKLDKLKDNYKYKYEIKIDDEVFNFVGSKNKNNESGHRLYNEEQLYYYIDSGVLYEVVDNQLKELEDLYENIDKNIIDVDKIKESITSKEYLKDNNKYSYILENNKIVYVYVNNENIEKIEIYLGEDYYKLEFSDIGLVGEINY